MAQRSRWPVIIGLAGGFATVWYFLHHRKPKLSGLGAAGGPIRTIQVNLNKIGVPVKPSGVLDDATVQAVNQIFDGSVDVPPKLATGHLSKHDIAANVGAVVHALNVIVHGAQNFQDVSRG